MSFEIHSATIDDIPELVRVFHESFREDRSFKACYGAVPFKLLEEFHIQEFQDIFSRWWVHYFKIIDSSNQQIAGFSGWRFRHPVEDEEAATQTAIANGKDQSLPWYRVVGLNVPLCMKLSDLQNEAKGHLYNQETDFQMEIIAVRPCYRRHGLGSLLMQEGLNTAEAMGAKVYLHASPLGLQLYKKFGFKAIAEITVDLEEHGQDGVISEICMIKEAADKLSQTRQIVEE